MTKVRIYDSEGYLKFGQPGDDQRSSFIREAYSSSKLRLYVDTRSKPYRAVCYFRAIESSGQRSEQFYGEIEFEGDVEALLPELKHQVESKAREIFHELDLSNPTTDAFEHLDVELDVSRYMDPEDVDAVKDAVTGGQQLTFGAGDHLPALALVQQLLTAGREYVVADAGRTPQFSDAELVLDTGFEGTGLAPSKETSRKLGNVKPGGKKDDVDEHIDAIESELAALRELKQRKGVSSSRVEEKLGRALDRYFPNLTQGGYDEPDTGERTTGKRVEVKTKKQSSVKDSLTANKPAVVGLLILAAVMVGAVVLVQTGGLPFLETPEEDPGNEGIPGTGNFTVEIQEEDSVLSNGPGQYLMIKTNVTNVAEENGTQNVSLKLNDHGGESSELDLSSSESEVLSLNESVDEDDIDDHVEDFDATVSTFNDSDTVEVSVGHPFFEVNVTSPEGGESFQLNQSKTIPVNGTVENHGLDGEKDVELRIENADEQPSNSTEPVDIERDGSQNVTFEWDAVEEGEFTANLSTDNDYDTVDFSVEGSNTSE